MNASEIILTVFHFFKKNIIVTKKIVYINLIIFLISFFFLFFILSNTYLNHKKKTCYQYEEFYYELKKNCKGLDKFKSSFPTVNVFTDEYGTRVGKNQKRNKSDKIFIFGDSFTFGVGLEFYQTYSGILSKEYKNFEFYNFAVSSYSPTVHLYKLEQQIKNKVIPKKIILFLDMTDVHDEAARWTKFGKNGKPSLSTNYIFVKNKKSEKFIHKNFKVSRSFAHYINYNLRILRRKQATKQKKNEVKTSIQSGFTYRKLEDLGSHYQGNIFNEGQNKIRQKINVISVISKKINSEFYLVIYPFAETLVYGQKIFNWENYGNSLCKDDKCILINTFEAFRNKKKKYNDWYSRFYFVGDEHFNYGGNKIIADVLKKKIFK
jgi:hypothetical protein